MSHLRLGLRQCVIFPEYMKSCMKLPVAVFFSLDSIRPTSAKDLLCDFDDLFDRFMHECQFLDISKKAQLEMKSQNTIVEPWPLRLEGKCYRQRLSHLMRFWSHRMRAICRMEENRLDGESLVLAFSSIDLRATIQRNDLG